MDPRKAATVTSPDLLAAFRQDTAGVGEASSSPLRVWVVLFTDEGTTEKFDLPLTEYDEAMERVRRHLFSGDNRGVAVVVSEQEPELFIDALDDISQLEQ
jgi:hypothetical protein